MGREEEDWLEMVYSAKRESELMEGYSGWAASYDSDLMRYGYRLPAVTAGMCGRHLGDSAGPILDAGCGTGLIGEFLHALDYDPIIGIDLSDEMLAIAERKGIYERLHKMRLGEHLDLEANTFVGVVAIGVFTVGHAPPEGFDELIRVTHPGGALIISVRVDNEHGAAFLERARMLAEEGRWRPVDRSRTIVSMPGEDPSIRHQVFVFCKASSAET
jgi:predicted TPR repeat methyltransferase